MILCILKFEKNCCRGEHYRIYKFIFKLVVLREIMYTLGFRASLFISHSFSLSGLTKKWWLQLIKFYLFSAQAIDQCWKEDQSFWKRKCLPLLIFLESWELDHYWFILQTMAFPKFQAEHTHFAFLVRGLGFLQ